MAVHALLGDAVNRALPRERVDEWRLRSFYFPRNFFARCVLMRCSPAISVPVQVPSTLGFLVMGIFQGELSDREVFKPSLKHYTVGLYLNSSTLYCILEGIAYRLKFVMANNKVH